MIAAMCERAAYVRRPQTEVLTPDPGTSPTAATPAQPAVPPPAPTAGAPAATPEVPAVAAPQVPPASAGPPPLDPRWKPHPTKGGLSATFTTQAEFDAVRNALVKAGYTFGNGDFDVIDITDNGKRSGKVVGYRFDISERVAANLPPEIRALMQPPTRAIPVAPPRPEILELPPESEDRAPRRPLTPSRTLPRATPVAPSTQPVATPVQPVTPPVPKPSANLNITRYVHMSAPGGYGGYSNWVQTNESITGWSEQTHGRIQSMLQEVFKEQERLKARGGVSDVQWDSSKGNRVAFEMELNGKKFLAYGVAGVHLEHSGRNGVFESLIIVEYPQSGTKEQKAAYESLKAEKMNQPGMEMRRSKWGVDVAVNPAVESLPPPDPTRPLEDFRTPLDDVIKSKQGKNKVSPAQTVPAASLMAPKGGESATPAQPAAPPLAPATGTPMPPATAPAVPEGPPAPRSQATSPVPATPPEAPRPDPELAKLDKIRSLIDGSSIDAAEKAKAKATLDKMKANLEARQVGRPPLHKIAPADSLQVIHALDVIRDRMTTPEIRDALAEARSSVQELHNQMNRPAPRQPDRNSPGLGNAHGMRGELINARTGEVIGRPVDADGRPIDDLRQRMRPGVAPGTPNVDVAPHPSGGANIGSDEIVYRIIHNIGKTGPASVIASDPQEYAKAVRNFRILRVSDLDPAKEKDLLARREAFLKKSLSKEGLDSAVKAEIKNGKNATVALVDALQNAGLTQAQAFQLAKYAIKYDGNGVTSLDEVTMSAFLEQQQEKFKQDVARARAEVKRHLENRNGLGHFAPAMTPDEAHSRFNQMLGELKNGPGGDLIELALKDPKLKINLIAAKSVNAFGMAGKEGNTLGLQGRGSIHIAADHPDAVMIAREELLHHGIEQLYKSQGAAPYSGKDDPRKAVLIRAIVEDFKTNGTAASKSELGLSGYSGESYHAELAAKIVAMKSEGRWTPELAKKYANLDRYIDNVLLKDMAHFKQHGTLPAFDPVSLPPINPQAPMRPLSPGQLAIAGHEWKPLTLKNGQVFGMEVAMPQDAAKAEALKNELKKAGVQFKETGNALTGRRISVLNTSDVRFIDSLTRSGGPATQGGAPGSGIGGKGNAVITLAMEFQKLESASQSPPGLAAYLGASAAATLHSLATGSRVTGTIGAGLMVPLDLFAAHDALSQGKTGEGGASLAAAANGTLGTAAVATGRTALGSVASILALPIEAYRTNQQIMGIIEESQKERAASDQKLYGPGVTAKFKEHMDRVLSDDERPMQKTHRDGLGATTEDLPAGLKVPLRELEFPQANEYNALGFAATRFGLKDKSPDALEKALKAKVEESGKKLDAAIADVMKDPVIQNYDRPLFTSLKKEDIGRLMQTREGRMELVAKLEEAKAKDLKINTPDYDGLIRRIENLSQLETDRMVAQNALVDLNGHENGMIRIGQHKVPSYRARHDAMGKLHADYAKVLPMMEERAQKLAAEVEKFEKENAALLKDSPLGDFSRQQAKLDRLQKYADEHPDNPIARHDALVARQELLIAKAQAADTYVQGLAKEMDQKGRELSAIVQQATPSVGAIKVPLSEHAKYNPEMTKEFAELQQSLIAEGQRHQKSLKDIGDRMKAEKARLMKQPGMTEEKAMQSQSMLALGKEWVLEQARYHKAFKPEEKYRRLRELADNLGAAEYNVPELKAIREKPASVAGQTPGEPPKTDANQRSEASQPAPADLQDETKPKLNVTLEARRADVAARASVVQMAALTEDRSQLMAAMAEANDPEVAALIMGELGVVQDKIKKLETAEASGPAVASDLVARVTPGEIPNGTVTSDLVARVDPLNPAGANPANGVQVDSYAYRAPAAPPPRLDVTTEDRAAVTLDDRMRVALAQYQAGGGQRDPNSNAALPTKQRNQQIDGGIA